MNDTGEMRRRFWKFPPDDYEYDPRVVKLMNEMLFRHSMLHNLEKIIVYGEWLETVPLAQPTAPGGDASSADGQNADQKGAE